MSSSVTFRSNGKLLLSGEYLVLYGSSALAIPTSKGQTMKVLSEDQNSLDQFRWNLKSPSGESFGGIFDYSIKILQSSDQKMANKLLEIFQYIESQKGPGYFRQSGVTAFDCELEFPMDWGLGSSSTLINNLANWSGLNPFSMQKEIFKGSGVDIACAGSDLPLQYTLVDGQPVWEHFNFTPPFQDAVFFIHLNEKQNSREGIARVAAVENKIDNSLIDQISVISDRMRATAVLAEFEQLMAEHEQVISDLIGIQAIKEAKFADFPGAIKSLGAWGGDFIMATGNASQMDYFRNKGFNTVISFKDMILSTH